MHNHKNQIIIIRTNNMPNNNRNRKRKNNNKNHNKSNKQSKQINQTKHQLNENIENFSKEQTTNKNITKNVNDTVQNYCNVIEEKREIILASSLPSSKGAFEGKITSSTGEIDEIKYTEDSDRFCNVVSSCQKDAINKNNDVEVNDKKSEKEEKTCEIIYNEFLTSEGNLFDLQQDIKTIEAEKICNNSQKDFIFNPSIPTKCSTSVKLSPTDTFLSDNSQIVNSIKKVDIKPSTDFEDFKIQFEEGAISMGNKNSKYTEKIQSSDNDTITHNHVLQGKVVVHRIIQCDDTTTTQDEKNGTLIESANANGKVIIHRIHIEDKSSDSSTANSILLSPISPDGIHIQEISDYSSDDYNGDNQPLISEAESENELNSLSPSDSFVYEVEASSSNLSSAIKVLSNDLKNKRQQKILALETHFLPQILSPRYLDSIIEENSDISDGRSDCSGTEQPIRKPPTNENNEAKAKKANASYPRSNLDFTKRHKHSQMPSISLAPSAIYEEPTTIVVEAKLIKNKPIKLGAERLTTLEHLNILESEAAEIVYIDSESTSSSTSDLLELQESEEKISTAQTFDLDTDMRDIISKQQTQDRTSRDSTPINQTTEFSPMPTSSTTTPTLHTETINEEHKINERIESNDNEIFSSGQPNEFVRENDAAKCMISLDTLVDNSVLSRRATDQNVEIEANKILEEMDNVRDLLNRTLSLQIAETYNDKKFELHERETQSPPPIPPLPSLSPTISTNDILLFPLTDQTNMTGLPDTRTPPTPLPVLTNQNNQLKRQESADSHYSDSTNHSHCTAINVGTNSISDKFDTETEITSTVLTRENVEKLTKENGSIIPEDNDIKKLRSLCTAKVASMPYGHEVLEELAQVSQNIGEISAAKIKSRSNENMPYPLPDLPDINNLQLPISPTKKDGAVVSEQTVAIRQLQTSPLVSNDCERSLSPPPVPTPPKPSLADIGSTPWLALPTDHDPKLLVCLSPSQQSYLKEQHTVDHQKADKLLDAHKKFIERRGYHELNNDQVTALNSEKSSEMKILKTAAIMKKLRKSLTPPPVPPPPIPIKSFETSAKVQQSQHKLAPVAKERNYDGSNKNVDDAKRQKTSTKSALSNGEENQHRLLTIIQDSSKLAQTFENNTKPHHQKITKINLNDKNENIEPIANIEYNTKFSTHLSCEEQQLSTSSPVNNSSNKMQGVDSEISRMFPILSCKHVDNIFDNNQKRFSNIETSFTPKFPTESKRYSNIETQSYEKKKLIENNKIIYDISDSKHEVKTFSDGDLTSTSTLKNSISSVQDPVIDRKENKSGTNADGIMSASNLNIMNTTQSTAAHSNEECERKLTSLCLNLNENEKTHHSEEKQKIEDTFKKDIIKCYDEFRQGAKSVTEKIFSEQKQKSTTSHNANENVFKDLDELSKELHRELETGRQRDLQRDKATSSFDLNRTSTDFKDHFEQLKKQRHEHMKELEQEIERSIKSRQFKFNNSSAIPIKIETDIASCSSNGYEHHNNGEKLSSDGRTYNIPIQVEVQQQTLDETDNARYRRAESMFNLSERHPISDQMRTQPEYYRPTKYRDDWARYASDLGSSENITRPFAREVEICYQSKQRPLGIRAPRLSVSTNDLSMNRIPHFDTHNSYISRPKHAPMLNEEPRKNLPHYNSCYSMIEHNPNPTYISTTTRRGSTPVPQFPHDRYYEEEHHKRRASLPREIHEQQLQYITSKEEELRTEFDRLQNERRRLMEDLQNSNAEEIIPLQKSSRSLREAYRSVAKLPPLSENEVFRQQMAEEWLNKVAEREERRLQRIIKISKCNEFDNNNELINHRNSMPDISDEFLSRVRERRTKLKMPADSDWESGAESHPIAKENISESEYIPLRVMEGTSEAKVNQLPRHLREFVKFSDHKIDHSADEHYEIHHKEEKCHENSKNSFCSAFKKSTMKHTVSSIRNANAENNTSSVTTPRVLNHPIIRTYPSTSGADNGYVQTGESTSYPPRPAYDTLFTKFRPTIAFSEMFARSPFKKHIYGEFEKFWRNFEHNS